jgi:hypothetical protein
MVERRRTRHVLSWAAIGVTAAAAAVACFLPGLEIAIVASIGAGFEQRSFRYARELTLAGDLRPIGPLAVAGAIAVVVAAAAGVVLGTRWWLVVPCFAVACGLAFLVLETEDERLFWSDGGVVGYERPNGGPLLQPALDDLKADARGSPEAQDPGWELLAEHGYAARGLTGWRLLMWSAFALFCLTLFRAARLGLGWVASVLVVAGTTAIVFLWLVWRSLTRL